jgi:hypothetical protein
MQRLILLTVLALDALLETAHLAQATTFTFSTIDVPRASDTAAGRDQPSLLDCRELRRPRWRTRISHRTRISRNVKFARSSMTCWTRWSSLRRGLIVFCLLAHGKPVG